MYINNIIMGWDSPQCIHDLISVVSGANRICSCTFHRFAILLSPEVPSIVRSKDFFLELSALISFQKSFHSPLWSFDSIDWERSWFSFSFKNFISCLKAARALPFSSASGPLPGRPAIFQWLTASLCRTFNSFALSFHPGTLNFEGFASQIYPCPSSVLHLT